MARLDFCFILLVPRLCHGFCCGFFSEFPFFYSFLLIHFSLICFLAQGESSSELSLYLVLCLVLQRVLYSLLSYFHDFSLLSGLKCCFSDNQRCGSSLLHFSAPLLIPSSLRIAAHLFALSSSCAQLVSVPEGSLLWLFTSLSFSFRSLPLRLFLAPPCLGVLICVFPHFHFSLLGPVVILFLGVTCFEYACSFSFCVFPYPSSPSVIAHSFLFITFLSLAIFLSEGNWPVSKVFSLLIQLSLTAPLIPSPGAKTCFFCLFFHEFSIFFFHSIARAEARKKRCGNPTLLRNFFSSELLVCLLTRTRLLLRPSQL